MSDYRSSVNALACMAALVLMFGQGFCRAEFKSLAPYLDEKEALEANKDLDLGSAMIEGPTQVEVLSYQTLVLVYVAGKEGIQPGGGIRIAWRHVHNWTRPQTEDPTQEGYISVRTSNGIPVSVAVEVKEAFRVFFPWQHMVIVTLPESGLSEGDSIRVTYGDRSGGSPGMRVQPFDETSFGFKVYVDADGEGEYLPLESSPSVEVVAAEPFRLEAVMPADATKGVPTWCIVRAEDRFGNPATSYRGTVEFSCADTSAILPEPYTFTPADGGVHRFEGIVFGQTGFQSVHLSDGNMQTVCNPVLVSDDSPSPLLLWGDLHGHTLFSDGRGTVEEFYDFAENVAGLDFCAVTDHAFEVVDWMWEHSKKVTSSVHTPGKFVTFQAYEWSGMTDVGGDHNVFFLEDDPPIYRSRSFYDYRNLQMYHGEEQQINHVEDLFIELASRFEDETVFCIPHYGGRKGNPAFHNPKVQRMIEVFSEHRRSEDWMTPFLTNGHRLGIIASTDGHYGNPGYGYLRPTGEWNTQEIGMAAVAVYAEERTRESIFEALYDRRVYATSGDRIRLQFQADGHPMGSEYETSTPPEFEIEAMGTSPIVFVEIKKNSEVVFSKEPNRVDLNLNWTDPEFDPSRECYYYVRILQDNNEEAISSPIWVKNKR